jgi:hypothetical protein
LIKVNKQFINRKPNTTYYITDKANILLEEFTTIIREWI